jgi:hypothetical protein
VTGVWSVTTSMETDSFQRCTTFAYKTGYISILFIFGLFKDISGNSGYMASNNWIVVNN